MGVLARRLHATGPDWRLAYKALLLLEYMAKHGPPAVGRELAANGPLLDRLSGFEWKDERGRDCGVNVRERAKRVSELVADLATLAAERARAATNADKYGGVSSSGAATAASGRVLSTVRGGGGSGEGFYSRSSGGGGGGYDSFGGGGRTDFSSSSSATASSGGFGGYGGGGAAPTTAAPPSPRDGDDPVAATRARIERLKAEGRAPADDGVGGRPSSRPASAGGVASSSAAPGRKRLSEIRVDPRVAASLPTLVAPAPPKASAGGGGGIDLLGELTGPAPVAAAPAAPAAAPADLLAGLTLDTPAAASEPWDAFAAAPSAAAPAPAPAAAVEPWDAFASAPPPKQAPLPDDLFAGAPAAPPPPTAGLGGGPALGGAAAAPPPADKDPFAGLLG